jgi:hypothetical protein
VLSREAATAAEPITVTSYQQRGAGGECRMSNERTCGAKTSTFEIQHSAFDILNKIHAVARSPDRAA